MSTALWMAVGIAGAAGAALAGWYISRRQMPALRALDAGFQCPDMRFHYTPQELFDGLDRLGAKGRAQLMRLWWADTGLGLSLLAVMAAAAHNSMAGLPAGCSRPFGKRAACPCRKRLSRPQARGDGANGGRGYGGQVVPYGAVGGRAVRRAGIAGGAAITGAICPERMILV